MKENLEISIYTMRKFFWQGLLIAMTGLKRICTFFIYSNNVTLWDKLYKRYILDRIKLPINRVYEDLYVNHLIMEQANRAVINREIKYNYFKRPNSITLDSESTNHINIVKENIERYNSYESCAYFLNRGSVICNNRAIRLLTGF